MNQFFSRILFLCIVTLTHGSLNSQSLATVKKLEFKASETKTLPGNSTEVAKGCEGKIKPEDQIGDFAIAAIFYQNSCYTDAGYSNKNYKVEMGTVSSSDGELSFPAIKVYAPETKATQFLASNHVGYFRSKSNQEINVFQLNDGSLSKVFKTNKAVSIPGGYNKIDGLVMSQIGEPKIYAFIPASVNFSPYKTIAPGIEGAKVYQGDKVEIDKYRFSIKGNIYDTANSFKESPKSYGTIYGQNRNFFTAAYSGGIIIIWQDQKNGDLFASVLDSSLNNHKQVKLTGQANFYLAAATADETGNLYYLLIEKSPEKGGLTSRQVLAFKSDVNGKNLAKTSLDGSVKGLNIVTSGPGYVSSMVYSNGKLGVITSRTMNKSPDGLNHQGAIGLILDAKSMKLLTNIGQTSGHSFGNILTSDSQGNFLGIDLGDNYPRGIHLHRFTESNRTSQVVYTFKTEHGTEARSPAGKNYPVYSEISGGGKTFYKWSNDNRTYTELGGIHEMENGIAILFAGEPDSNGKAINNSQALGTLTDSRNLGMVYVKKDFSNPEDFVLSSGENEDGGFYSFGGTFSKQKNKGIVWFTNFKNSNKENVSRVKTAKIANNTILSLWEVWNENDYSFTQLSIIDPEKGSSSKPESLGSGIRLGWREDPLQINKKVYIVSGNPLEEKLEVHVISPK